MPNKIWPLALAACMLLLLFLSPTVPSLEAMSYISIPFGLIIFSLAFSANDLRFNFISILGLVIMTAIPLFFIFTHPVIVHLISSFINTLP
ncbi:MAG: hypothetical protein A2Y20_00710 [Firmicutes bacterium GWF2_51_9]|uniref:Uncharacterized protein n=1 Tax=Candidatus Collierbacteria bacterium GW2011_GWC2_43_12 TaxID=1618390 RepID=A0A0G1D717_9BACT|nr:MAG: hypothetical protein UV68_C0020G0012 [Candidatus Collierbacteria bacterium GW2011_GWC2_43_12]KKT83021.1 MAG: hypothetical protein UW80_C0024G0012 [Microgenomates group bacterium GW2011_GWC1_44_9]OGS53268.1 MAG: hypothetical protein A2Y20_00710 [Firmicutes bacterium GWF2_51_9]